MNNKVRFKKVFIKFIEILGIVFLVLFIIARRKKHDYTYDNEIGEKNPLEGKKVTFVECETDCENADGIRGHLESVEDGTNYVPGLYEKYVKRTIDILLSFCGLIVLSPLMCAIALAIKIEDPGPVFFSQKRVGQNKKYFKLHKFRSMKMNTPHDVPTHMLENPEQYITRIGKFIRSHSLDELPQIWDIFIGNMSIIGPRPGLWNQDLLTAERDKYNANDVKPGLTGWAQINGRDELEIPDKAILDGEYVEKMGFLMDVKVFLGSLHVFGRDDSVVEGGTGEIKKTTGRCHIDGTSERDIIGHIGFGEAVSVDSTKERKILITGANSYIGNSFCMYAKQHYPTLTIDELDMLSENWRDRDFSVYDVVYHVAGIAHADVGHVDETTRENYYAVNTDLAIEVCEKAKRDGVKVFVFMSSMIVYGDSMPYGKAKVIDENTVPKAANFYGDSKLQADVAVRALADDFFKVIVLRPPMIYGKESKGNYPTLAKLAKRVPVFPDVENQRSMLHIDNLSELLCQIMYLERIKENAVVLLPQNREWTNTTDMVRTIADVSGKKIRTLKVLRPIVGLGGKIPGKIGELVNKAFGNNCYTHDISEYEGIDYQKTSLNESIIRTEGNERLATNRETSDKEDHSLVSDKKSILVVSQYFYPETFRINDMCQEWVKRGYRVTVVTGIPNYPMGKFYAGYGLKKRRHEIWNGIEIYRIPLVPRGSKSLGMMLNYFSFMLSGIMAGKLKRIKADLVFSFEVSPMTQVLTGISFAKRLHVPHYLYVQDLWPENVITVTGIKSPFVIKPIEKMVDYIYKNTDIIFATSPSFVNAICNRSVPVDKEKVYYWPQYAEDFYHPVERQQVKEIPDDDSFKIIFTGNIGTAQGLQILPRVARLLRNENIKFVMVGDGRYLADFNKDVCYNGVEDMFVMVARQPAEKIPELMAVCDAAFLSFQDDKLWRMTIPAKLQSYLACGMPIIAAAQGETERIICEAQCGVCSAIGDAKDLSIKIKEMMNSNIKVMRENSRRYFEEHFDKKTLMDQMEFFLQNSEN